MNAGKWLIVGIFAVAIAGAAASWMHRYYRTDFVRERFGTAALQLVESSPQVEAIRYTGVSDAARKNVTRSPGMLNIRHMLGSDFSFADADPQTVTFSEKWELAFKQGEQLARFGFNADCSTVRQEGEGKVATLVPDASTHIRDFFAEQFGEESKDDAGERNARE